MKTSFARKMEEKAGEIAESWPGYDSDIKCWYNPRCMFEGTAERVFIGINPRLEPSTRRGEDHSYLDFECSRQTYNEWIDARWPGSGSDHQAKLQRVFKTLYGVNGWEQMLRSTPCFNVSPLRTENADDIPDWTWRQSKDWCQEVIESLRPATIICNGSAESGKSPWAFLKERFHVRKARQTKVQVAYLKIGKIEHGLLNGTDVIGLPQLTRFGNRPLLDALSDVNVA